MAKRPISGCCIHFATGSESSSLCGAVLEREAGKEWRGGMRRQETGSSVTLCEKGFRVRCKSRAKHTFQIITLQEFYPHLIYPEQNPLGPIFLSLFLMKKLSQKDKVNFSQSSQNSNPALCDSSAKFAPTQALPDTQLDCENEWTAVNDAFKQPKLSAQQVTPLLPITAASPAIGPFSRCSGSFQDTEGKAATFHLAFLVVCASVKAIQNSIKTTSRGLPSLFCLTLILSF